MKRVAKACWLGLLCLAAAASLSARADVVVIVSAKSRVTALTAQEIADIYLGRSATLRPTDNAAGVPPIRNSFYSKVVGKDDAQVKAIWSALMFTGEGRPPKMLSSDAQVVSAVAANPRSIGYVERSRVDASVKIVFEVK